MAKYHHQIELVFVEKDQQHVELVLVAKDQHQHQHDDFPNLDFDGEANLDFDVEANLDFDVEALDPHLPFEVLVEIIGYHRPRRQPQQEPGGAERASTPPTPSYGP